MTINYVDLFAPQQLTTSNVNLFVVPSMALLRNGRLRVSNTTASAATIKLWAVPSGLTALDSNVCLPVTSIPANSFTDFDLPVMQAGATLIGVASANTSLTIHPMDGFYQY